jgi:hypothetical protein
LNIYCLFGGCKKTFIEDEIKKYIGDQLFKKYKKFKKEQIILSNPNKNYLYCPIPNCEEMVEIVNEEITFFECSAGHKFCGRCKTAGYHKKGKCNDVLIFFHI